MTEHQQNLTGASTKTHLHDQCIPIRTRTGVAVCRGRILKVKHKIVEDVWEAKRIHNEHGSHQDAEKNKLAHLER